MTISTIRKYKKLIPVLALTCLCITTVISTISRDINGEIYFTGLSLQQYGGLTFIILNCLSFFLFRKYYKYILTLTLLLGAGNIINFTQSVIFATIGTGSFKVGFQPVILLIIILTYFLDRKRLNNTLQDLLGTPPEQLEKLEQEKYSERIKKYKERYNSCSDEELNNILINDTYISETKEAVRQILKNRQEKKIKDTHSNDM